VKALRITLLVPLVLLLLFLPSPSLADERPNIILFLTDDLSKTEIVRLKGFRDTLEQGRTFPRAYVTDPNCCPSRASILLGKYVHNHGIITNNPAHNGGWQAFRPYEDETVAVRLKEAGYSTALFGKYLNNYDQNVIPPGWDRWFVRINNYYTGTPVYRVTDNGRIREFDLRDNSSTNYLLPPALRFIRNAERPFFLVFSTEAPHGPYWPERKYRDDFSRERYPLTPSYNERDVSDKPPNVRRLPVLGEEARRDFDESWRGRLRELLTVRDAYGKMLRVLAEEGELDNTYIIFTSDNGFHMGQHRLGKGKHWGYREDIEVPYYVRGPEVPPRSRTYRLVSHMDLAPTFLEIAGLPPDPEMDGMSLLDVYRNRQVGWRGQLLVEGWRYSKDYTSLEHWQTLVRPMSFYIRYPDKGWRELYYAKDRYQLESRHGDVPEETIRKLDAAVFRLAGCSGTQCRRYDGYRR